ncbi:uncharacterized protein RCO7_10885 [Rhynchosporium graminicola]|uniref:Uncharacterized protein n=1 Tax=Rhynchosporium graminicola TaxID=2792576 RepID=A0A1E1LBR4_9HELO|nr:uncharacterized protein RCO7_10885 [Rhynchosporium commune]
MASSSINFEDCDDDNEDGFVLDDGHEILRRSRQALGLHKGYVPGWKPDHALREFYQNWKDAIVEGAQIQHKDLKVLNKGFNNEKVYIVEARHPTSNKLLGFIRLKDGMLELTNFGAQLSRRALHLGKSSKKNNAEAAGKHGEGFKVASLVMIREGYKVQYEASKCRWKMKLHGKDLDTLYCFLDPPSDATIQNQMKAYRKKVAAGTPRELKNNMWEDVCVQIGQVRRLGEKIETEDFKKWIKVVLDLDPPSKMIQTVHGSLILDPMFSNKLYLKGLLLERNFGKEFRFGYNLLAGQVNRDRERLVNSKQEAKRFANIWAEAIEIDKNIVEKFVSMLREDKVADVQGVYPFISEEVAAKLWQHLLEQDGEDECFYHDIKNGHMEIELIKKSLKKTPAQLPTLLWETFQRYNLVRTPREQQCRLLSRAPVSTNRTTPYSLHVARALRAALALDVRTKDLNVILKSGVKADLDLLLEGTDLQINDKWLDFEEGHRLAPCWLSRQKSRKFSDYEHFSCDHIVTDLYEMVLEELKRFPESSSGGISESDNFLYQRVCECLRQMPLMITSQADPFSHMIRVSWSDLEGDVLSRLHGLDPKCRVTLHQESTCASRRGDLLLIGLCADQGHADRSTSSRLSITEATNPCQCPQKIVSQKDFGANFDDLDHKQHYFPMVSRNDCNAFFGLAPESLSPIAISIGIKPENSSPTTPRSRGVRSHERSSDGSDSSNLRNQYGDLGNENESPSNSIPNPSASRSITQSYSNGLLSSGISRRYASPGNVSPVSGSASRVGQDIEQLQAKNESLTGKVAAKNWKLSALKKQIASLTIKLADTEKELQALRLNFDSTKTAFGDLEEKNATFETEVLQKQQQIETAEEAVRQVRGDLEASQQRCAELQNSFLQSCNVNEDLEEQLGTTHRELIQVNAYCENNKGQLEDATVDSLAKIDQIERLELDIRNANEKLQAHHTEIDGLNARILRLSSGKIADGDEDCLPSQLQRLQITCDQLRTQRRGLKDRIADLERRLSAAEQAYDTQVRLASDTAQRRDRNSQAFIVKSELSGDATQFRGLKREREDDDDLYGAGNPGPPSRALGNVINLIDD